VSGIEWPAIPNCIPCMAHIIQLALGAFMCSLGVKGRTKSLEAHERYEQFEVNESIVIGNSQRLQKEGNTRINKVSAMWPGLAKITKKVRSSRYFECPETDLYTTPNDCCIDYADTWSSEQVCWPSQSLYTICGTTYSGCEDRAEFGTGVGWTGLPIRRIQPQVAQVSKIQWLLVIHHNAGQMDYHQVWYGSVKAILVLDAVDV